MSAWDKLLQIPTVAGHFVQFYGADELSLARNVGSFLRHGFEKREGLIVVAESGPCRLFQHQLRHACIDVDEAIQNGRMILADANETLAKFMRNGQPDWDLFEVSIGEAMRKVRPHAAGGRLRVYGEMVGILWNAGQFAAAVRLEQFWNKLLRRTSFSLFCGYAIDVFGNDFQKSPMDGLLCTHSHVLPGTSSDLEPAIRLAMEEILGAHASCIASGMSAGMARPGTVIPRGEALALWLRANLPHQARPIMTRAQQHYRSGRGLSPRMAA